MGKEDIIADLFAYIRDKFDIGDDPDYTTEVHLFDYGFVDSLDATEILLFLSEHFHVEITQKDIVLYPMNTVEEIAAVVWEKVRDR